MLTGAGVCTTLHHPRLSDVFPESFERGWMAMDAALVNIVSLPSPGWTTEGTRNGGRMTTGDRAGAVEADDLAMTRMVSRAVKRAQEGDREALGFLYARYADNVCGYVCSIVHDQHEAEDVTQQVFAKLIRVIGKYEEREVPFFAWLLRVSRNVAVDHLRRQQAIPVEEVRTAEHEIGSHSDARRLTELQEALASLPADQREVLVLRHIAGLSPTEIAEHLGRSEGSIHGLHHRGRRALTAELTSRGAAPATARPQRGDAQVAG
jgi:RNA polymerase sigma-70 factor (ECF subfamily)